MNHHVVMEKLCGCAKKANLSQIESFTCKEDAQEFAYALADKLNNSYCGKDGFDVVEVDVSFQETSLRERYACFVIFVEGGGFVEACEL